MPLLSNGLPDAQRASAKLSYSRVSRKLACTASLGLVSDIEMDVGQWSKFMILGRYLIEGSRRQGLVVRSGGDVYRGDPVKQLY